MADKRMITRKVTDDDNFLNLSSSAQALYLHLSMAADDDGFCNQVSVSMFKAHASINDLQALLAGRFIYQFDNGVIVIKHWRMANALRKDRYTPTTFQEEMALLQLKENGAYTRAENPVVDKWLPNGCQVVAADKNRLDKDRLEENRLDKDRGMGEGKYQIPLQDGTYPVTETEIEGYQALYPSVDVEQEIRSMVAWSNANPTKRKTRKGVKRFINGWLSRAMQTPKKKSFIEAAAELERELL